MARSRWMDGWVAGKADVAKSLLAQGVDPVVIMAATGLSQEQVQQLAAEKSA